MPRVRLTVRQAMLAVLVVAALLGAFEAGRRWERGARPPATRTVMTPMGMFRIVAPPPASR